MALCGRRPTHTTLSKRTHGMATAVMKLSISARRHSAVGMPQATRRMSPARAVTSTIDAVTSQLDCQEPGTASQTPTFVWTQHWLPVSPVCYLDKQRPTAHQVLGQPLAVWLSEAADTWNVMLDMCPHRLAPLSEGRIVNNNLMCSHHGWEFGPSGECTSIPHVNPERKAAACANKRSCATTYPARVHEGVLYVWLDISPKGLELSKVRGLTGFAGKAAGVPYMTQFPVDARPWFEQGWDPTHANFLHHSSGFLMENARFMPAWNASKVDMFKGFTLEHSGYEASNISMKASRVFVPPCHNIAVYRKPTVTMAVHLSIVPVAPGTCRSIVQTQFLPPGVEPTLLADGMPRDIPFTTDAKQQTPAAPTVAVAGQAEGKLQETRKAKPVPMGLQVLRFLARFKPPHWVVAASQLMQADEDVVLMAEMDRNMAKRGLTHRNYHVASKDADIGVVHMNRWLNMAGYPAAAYPGLDTTTSVQPADAMHLETLLDRRASHVNHCVICQEGERLVTKLCWGVSFAAGLLAAFSTALAAQTAWSALQGAAINAGALVPVAGLLLLSGILTAAALELWSLREFTFINGASNWRRTGGLSLIPRV